LSTPEKLELSDKVIGDINYPTSSRGAELSHVFPLERRKIVEEDYTFLKKETKLDDIARLLNYEII
jgi:hypothetical protein